MHAGVCLSIHFHHLFEKLYNGLLYFFRLLLLMNLLVSSRFVFASWQVAHGRLMIPPVWNKSEIRMEVNEDGAGKIKTNRLKKEIERLLYLCKDVRELYFL